MVEPKRIAIIGRGSVGSALQEGLGGAGHEVRAVGKEPGKVREAAKWAEVIVLAVPFAERMNAVREMGEGAEGKVVVDATNAITKESEFAASLDRSGAEELQSQLPRSHVVKAFNTVFAKHMRTGMLAGEPLTVFAAGDDDGARRTVLELVRDIGFDAVDAGPLETARWLEPLGYLNITLGYQRGLGPDMGFRIVRAQAPQALRREVEASQKR